MATAEIEAAAKGNYEFFRDMDRTPEKWRQWEDLDEESKELYQAPIVRFAGYLRREGYRIADPEVVAAIRDVLNRATAFNAQDLETESKVRAWLTRGAASGDGR